MKERQRRRWLCPVGVGARAAELHRAEATLTLPGHGPPQEAGELLSWKGGQPSLSLSGKLIWNLANPSQHRLRNPDLQGLLVRLIRPLPCLATRRTFLRRHGRSLSDIEWRAGILVIRVCVGLSTWCWTAFCGGRISAQGARQTGTALTVAPGHLQMRRRPVWSSLRAAGGRGLGQVARTPLGLGSGFPH